MKTELKLVSNVELDTNKMVKLADVLKILEYKLNDAIDFRDTFSPDFIGVGSGKKQKKEYENGYIDSLAEAIEQLKENF